jgi:membrane-associated protease RseP (regulator of RpoE activity)
MDLRLLPVVLLSVAAMAAEPAPAPAQGAPAAEAQAPVVRPSFGWTVPDGPASETGTPGLQIIEVRPGGTAAALGIEAGDRIRAINGTMISASEHIRTVLAAAKVGDQVTVEFDRAGAVRTATGALLERPRPANLAGELNAAKGELESLKSLAANKAKEPSLAEILQSLKDLDQRLPKAVAAFKKQYPNGEFDISIKIRITSDKNATDAIELSNVTAPDAEAKPVAEPQAAEPAPPAQPAPAAAP